MGASCCRPDSASFRPRSNSFWTRLPETHLWMENGHKPPAVITRSLSIGSAVEELTAAGRAALSCHVDSFRAGQLGAPQRVTHYSAALTVAHHAPIVLRHPLGVVLVRASFVVAAVSLGNLVLLVL